jgi:serine/threonine-protein phosphatase 6 regulatory ankyrin repeat subunit B
MKNTVTIILISIVAAFFLFRDAGAASDSNESEISENLIQAVESIDIISLNVLLAEGAQVDTVDEGGNTPLMLAAKIGNPRMVKILLAHQPEIDRTNHSGYTALMIAAEQGQIFIVENLLAEGASENLTNPSGLTAADLALRNGHPDVADLLERTEGPVFSR